MSNRAYFLGCPTPEGFETHFSDEIRSGKFLTYIIKGGPGTGKSTLMKRLASELEDVDEAELYYCSSDPDSLDGILFRKLGVIFVDGTSPHVFEPTYPGARERLLDLGRFWNCDTLRENADKIVELSDSCLKLHQRVRRYLGAICGINADTASAGESALLKSKLDGYAKRLSVKLFPKTGEEGSAALRQITTVTPYGVITQQSAFDGCRRYVINDPYFAVTDVLLKRLSSLAASAGYDVIASKNVMLPGCAYEHIAVPGAGVSIVSESGMPEDGDAVRINAMRFYDREVLRDRRRRLSFNSNLRRELTSACIETLSAAKSLHDVLERNYISAMDFSSVEALTAQLVAELRSKA